MVLAVLLAHIVGDYILQWGGLSRWKSEQLSGVLVHGLIVLGVTLLFTLPIDPSWWPWALFIGLTHTLIDGLEIPLRRRLADRGSGKEALALFAGDQLAHLSVIALALIGSGYLDTPTLGSGFVAASYDNRLLAFILAYAFLTMPAWIIIRFVVYGLMNGTTPDFSPTFTSKYLGMLERGLIATLVLFGQFYLVPMVALPRLIFTRPQTAGSHPGHQGEADRPTVLHAAEMLTSVALAVAIGLALRQLLGVL